METLPKASNLGEALRLLKDYSWETLAENRLRPVASNTMIIDLAYASKDVAKLQSVFANVLAEEWGELLTFEVKNVSGDASSLKSAKWTTDGAKVYSNGELYGEVTDPAFKSWIGSAKEAVLQKGDGEFVSLVPHVAKTIWSTLKLNDFMAEKWDSYHVEGVRERGPEFDAIENKKDEAFWKLRRRKQKVMKLYTDAMLEGSLEVGKTAELSVAESEQLTQLMGASDGEARP